MVRPISRRNAGSVPGRSRGRSCDLHFWLKEGGATRLGPCTPIAHSQAHVPHSSPAPTVGGPLRLVALLLCNGGRQKVFLGCHDTHL